MNRREDLVALALLLLLVITAFANVVFDGRSLVPSDNLSPLKPQIVPPAEWLERGLLPHPNYRDQPAATQQGEASQQFLRQSLENREFPFWDPYLGGGAPSFASMIPGYLFPPGFLVALLGAGSGVKNFYILLLILTSGTLTYFYLRRFTSHWSAAFVGGIAFAFSGAIIQTTPSFIGQAVAFFALPLLVTDRLMQAPNGRRAAQLALAFAFVATTTFAPVLLQIFSMCVVYSICSIAFDPQRRGAKIGWFIAGSAVSLMLVAFALLPALMSLREMPHITEYYKHAAEATLPAKRLLQLLSPTLMGGPPIYNQPAIIGEVGQLFYYTGVVALFLAGIGTFAPIDTRARALRWTALLCGGLSIAKMIGIPPVQWIIYVPFLRNFHYASYFGMIVAFCISVLAFLGFDALWSRRARIPHIAISGAILCGALLALRIAATRNFVADKPDGFRWFGDFHRIVILSALIIAFALLSRRWTRVAALIIAVLAFESIWNSAYPRRPRGDVWRNPPQYIAVMRQRNSGGRVMPMIAFPANTQSPMRIPTLDSILTASTRMHTLYSTYFGPIPDVILRNTRRFPPERVLDVANVEYFAIELIEPQLIAEAQRRGYESIFRDDYVNLMRRPTVARYSFTSQYQVANEQQALAALPTLPDGTVLLERAPSFPSTNGSDVQPRIVKFALNEVGLSINAPRAGMLVCSESNMSGWTATIDDRVTSIVPANYAFRAVEVPAGAHTIRLRYRAPGFRAGLFISALGVLALIAGSVRAKSANDE